LTAAILPKSKHFDPSRPPFDVRRSMFDIQRSMFSRDRYRLFSASPTTKEHHEFESKNVMLFIASCLKIVRVVAVLNSVSNGIQRAGNYRKQIGILWAPLSKEFSGTSQSPRPWPFC